MPLPATHLRFALALQQDWGVLDLPKFVAGAVYPDTRYLTGLRRELTHDLDAFRGRRDLTDFEKGWLAHVLGDRVFYEVTEEKFADLILVEDPGERWPVLGAIKIIQDMVDFRSFDIQSVLGYLDYYEIHFHEDERKVIEYYHIIQEIYRGKEKLTVEDYLSMWKRLGRSPSHLQKLRRKLVELYAEEGMVERINGNFEDGMDLYGEKYSSWVRELVRGKMRPGHQ